uniref:BTB domain-containing protein n=1 Tax=Strongyloides stercoralis TaxID=6248 RepID=A0AAF5D0V4_STRER
MKIQSFLLIYFSISIIKLYYCKIIVNEALYLLARKNFSKEIAHAIYQNFNITKGEVYEGSLCRAANYNVLSNNNLTLLTPIYLIVEKESKYVQCQEDGLKNFLILHIYGRKDGSGIIRIEKFNKINFIFELYKYDYYHIEKALILFKKLKITLTSQYSGSKKIYVPPKNKPSYWVQLITGSKSKDKIEDIDNDSTNIISYFNFILLIGILIISSTIIVILIYFMKKKHKTKKFQLNRMILELKQANTLDIPKDKELIDPNDIKSYFHTIINQVSKYIDSYIKESNDYDVIPEPKNIEKLMILEPYIGIDRIPKSTIKMIEQGVYNWFGKAIGLSEVFLYKQNSFNTTVDDSLFQSDGGGLILSNNTLANLYVLFGARKMKFEKISQNNELKNNLNNQIDVQKKFVVYMNEDQLGNYEKLFNSILVQCKGIPFSEKIELCQACLTKQIEEDINDGLIPFLVIASFASTTLCSYDNLTEISYVCEKFDIWFHIDATYGGFSLINSKIRKLAIGIEKCNSLLICPDKFMICSPEISILFTRNFKLIYENVNVKELQDPEDKWLINMDDVKKFLPLKLWFVFKIYGIEKLRERITKLIQDTNNILILSIMTAILPFHNNMDYNNGTVLKYSSKLLIHKGSPIMDNEIKIRKSYKSIPTSPTSIENWKVIMNRFRKNNVFTDVILCNNIRAHKCFLASESKYFEKLFTNPYNKDKNKFDFHNINDEAMDVVIDYFYTNEFKVDKNNAHEVLIAAGELEVEELIKYCQDICNKQMDKSKRLRSEHITSSSQKELYLFGGLSWRRAEGYITAPTEVYNLMESSRNPKEPYLPTINDKKTLNRFGNALTKIGNKVYAIGGQNHDEILNNIESLEIYLPESTWKSIDTTFCFNSKYLESVTIDDKVYLFGVDSNNYRDKDFHKGFHVLDFNSLKMISSKSLPLNLYTPNPVSIGNTIYVIGDDVDNSGNVSWIRKKSVCHEGSVLLRNDIRINEWEKLPCTKFRKFECCMILYDDSIYCTGGGYPHTCEIFDIRKNCWREMANSMTASYYSKLVLLDGKIHKIGHSCYNEMYEPKINEWIRTEKIRYPRFGFSTCVI